MNIPFTKMHSLGNDFMVMDNRDKRINLSAEQIQSLSNRKTGIGFDQILMLEPATRSDCDFFYRIYNADGGEVAQCGNGARALAHFIADQNISTQKSHTLETIAGTISTQLLDNDLVKVNLGQPQIGDKVETLQFNDHNITFLFVDIGNPHAVILSDDLQTIALDSIGAAMNSNSRFPHGVNVEWLQILSPKQTKMRVFERGVGETDACGSGAAAAAVAGFSQELLKSHVTIDMPGGQLSAEFVDNHIYLIGNAVTVYDGQLEL
jgi:diaminopimelate epimerase